MKALTAAEHSRRQFILNYAASKDTSLLMPGKKSDVVKLSEQWVVGWLHQNNLNPVSSEFFKYTVDTHLWSTYGMSYVTPIYSTPLLTQLTALSSRKRGGIPVLLYAPS